jgi:TatD DNase family protein
MEIFDSHCHLQFPQYDADREEVLRCASDAGISLICIGTDFETSKSGIELAQRHDNMWATVGLHPSDVSEHFDTLMYQSILSEPKVVAVGEIGLDYYRTPEPEKQEVQKQVFKQFLDLAIQYNKPIILHARDAGKGSTGKVHADMIAILASHYSLLANGYRGVAHSFTGTTEEAEKYLDLGFHLGFNGIITFARQYDEMIRSVPLDKILLETDAPFLAPERYRGKRNEPSYIIEVAKKIAELKNQPLEKVIGQTTLNCKQLFRI